MRARLNKSMEKMAERFEFLSIRERGLITLTVITVIFMAWNTFLMEPIQHQQTLTINEMQDINNKLEKVTHQLKSMSYKQQMDNEPKLLKRIEEIKRLLSDVKKEQNDVAGEFVAPEHMNSLLQDMLKTEKNLKLKELKSLGVEPLRLKDMDALGFSLKNADGVEKVDLPVIYKHGMQIKFEGDYFTTLRYLKSLEEMPWRFYWDSVDYRVVDFPRAEVSLVVHTLSLNEWWIGV